MNIVWSGVLVLRSSLLNLLRELMPTQAGVAQPGAPLLRPATPTLRIERRPVAPRPLRVVRVMEVGQPRSQVGRMVISGRMADVCAELDRLAACDVA